MSVATVLTANASTELEVNRGGEGHTALRGWIPMRAPRVRRRVRRGTVSLEVRHRRLVLVLTIEQALDQA